MKSACWTDNRIRPRGMDLGRIGYVLGMEMLHRECNRPHTVEPVRSFLLHRYQMLFRVVNKKGVYRFGFPRWLLNESDTAHSCQTIKLFDRFPICTCHCYYASVVMNLYSARWWMRNLPWKTFDTRTKMWAKHAKQEIKQENQISMYLHMFHSILIKVWF